MAYTTIKKASDYFNTKLYSGNNSTNAITGVNFSPDLLWLKPRNAVNSHRFIDQVRGGSFGLASNNNAAEYSTGSNFTSFDTDGFTVAGSDDGWNQTGINYAAWNWLASNTTASNTDGSITSTVSVNTTSGFSIVSYTGTGTVSDTVGHGLGVVPKMVICKKRSAVENWQVRHESLASNYNIWLNDADRAYNMTTEVNTGGIANLNSSSTFGFLSGIQSANSVNESGATYIAYCFAEKKGFSKFGSYVGNGSTDGAFVYIGFKPAFVIVKCSNSDQAGNAWWVMYDNKRVGYNSDNRSFGANASDTEYTNNSIDLLSNGFKLRDTNTGRNASGATYIYMAFAEEPLVGDNPATAR